MARKRGRKSRVVPAPEPTVSSACLPNRVVSVLLRPGEQVRWIWTSGPDGQYVSGYTIIKTRSADLDAGLADDPPHEVLGVPGHLPADVIVRPKLVVTRRSGAQVLKHARTGKPTKALRDLMR